MRALADSRLSAEITFRQFGCTREKGRLVVREGDRLLASREVTLKAEGAPQTEALVFNAGLAGPRSFQFAIEPLAGEENVQNNRVMRLVNVTSAKPRILYFEGEPRWEYKFIHRGIEDDRSLQLASIVRTTQNKIYGQGVQDAKELLDGFPSKAESLFAFDGLIIGSIVVAAQTVWSSGVGASVGLEAGYTQLASGFASWIGRLADNGLALSERPLPSTDVASGHG